MKPISNSKITLWKRCKLAYWYRYHARAVGGPVSEMLLVGSGVHEFMEKYLAAAKRDGAAFLASEEAQALAVKIASEYPIKAVEDRITEICLRVIEGSANRFVAFDDIRETIAVESRIGLGQLGQPEIFNDGDKFEPAGWDFAENIFRGIVDLWYVSPGVFNTATGEIEDQYLVIRDWKSGFKKLEFSPDRIFNDESEDEEIEIDPGDDFQLLAYAYVLYNYLTEVKNLTLSPNIRLHYDMLAIPSRSTAKIVEAESIKWVGDEIKKQRKAVAAAEKWDHEKASAKATIGLHCKYCDAANYCRALQKSESSGFGRARLIEWIRAKEHASQSDKALKNYLKDNGDIDMGEQGMFGFIEKVSYSWDGEAALDFLSTYIEDVGQFARDKMHLSKTEMEKHSKKYKFDMSAAIAVAEIKMRKELAFKPNPQ